MSRRDRTPLEENLLCAFVDRFWADREAGQVHGLGHYLEQFSGHEELIAREWVELDAVASAEEGAGEEPRVGPYRLLREIGRGGQAVVWLARDDRLDRPVALKVLREQVEGVGELLRRFRREAEITAALDHPGICPVYDVGEDGVPWIAMRYIEGETLAERLKVAAGEGSGGRSPVVAPEGEVDPATSGTSASTTTSSSTGSRRQRRNLLLTFEKVARALHVAHEAGVVHRDVKPGNIMISSVGEPVILDFGIARQADPSAATLTRSGQFTGTPIYMPPEQVRGGQVDRRADVYSLGVTLFEALTGSRPFSRPTLEATFHAILEEDAPRLRVDGRAFDRDLETVVLTAMQKDANRRYATAEALADDLGRLARREPVAARRIGPLGRSWRWALRHPAAASLLIVLAVGLPSLTATLSYIAVTREDVRRQERSAHREDIEGRLAAGLEEIYHGDVVRGLDMLESAARDGRSIEGAVAVHAWALVLGDRLQDALAITAADPDLALLDALARRRTIDRQEEADAALPDPESPLDWFLIGTAAFRQWEQDALAGTLDRATHALRTAVLISPRPRLVFLAEYARALSAMMQSQRPTNQDEIRSLIHALHDRWPDSHVSWYWAARLYRWFDPEAGERAYAEAISRAPQHRVFEYRLNRAILLAGVPARLEESLEILAELAETSGEVGQRVEALRTLGRVLRSEQRPERAAEVLSRAIAMGGNEDPSIWRDLGFARGALADRDGSREAFERSLALQPHATTRVMLALALRELGRAEEALVVAAQAFEDPRRGDPREQLLLAEAAWWLSQAANHAGRTEEVLAWSRKGTEVSPEQARHWLQIAAIDFAQDRFEKSRDAARRVLEIEPKSVEARLILGASLANTKEETEAFNHMNVVWQSNPEKTALYDLAIQKLISGMHGTFQSLLKVGSPETVVKAIRDISSNPGDPYFRMMMLIHFIDIPGLGVVDEGALRIAALVPELPAVHLDLMTKVAGMTRDLGHPEAAMRLLEAIIERRRKDGAATEELQERLDLWRQSGSGD